MRAHDPHWVQMLKYEQTSSISQRRGTAVIEMLFLCTTLAVLGFGLAEYGSYFGVKGGVQHAARAGALEAARPTATNASVQSAIAACMNSSALKNSGYIVNLNPPNMQGLPTGQPISVNVQCTWANVGLHALPPGMVNIWNSKVISASVLMNRE